MTNKMFAIGYLSFILNDGPAGCKPEPGKEKRMKTILQNWLSNETRVTVVCVALSAAALICSLMGWLSALPVDIAWVGIILCGVPIVVGAAVALITEHDIKADVLVAIALIASVIAGEWFAAGEVALIMQIGSLLEDYTDHRARRGIAALVALTPKTARLVADDGSTLVVPAADVAAGQTLRVVAGETIPADGVITVGETSVDQSVMTGEPLPVDAGPGDAVISGTVNRCGSFDMRVTAAGTDSALARVIALAEAADAEKAPIVGLADRWASWLVLAALACAVVTGVVTHQWMRAVTVLVVFCPCAFILATPTAVAAAIGNLTRYGVLIRTGDALERLAAVERLAFDKTGTLTAGKPAVVSVAAADGDDARLLQQVAAVEARSEHPLGKAIAAAADGPLPEAAGFEMTPGQGVAGTVAGHRVLAGRKSFIAKRGVDVADTAAAQVGQTVIFAAVDGRFAGTLALADTLRPAAADAVAGVKRLGIAPMLLTGDHAEAAAPIARAVGIDTVRGDLLPDEKLAAVRYNAADPAAPKIAMVGDGVNDAPALAAAYAGIAMGGIGSDIAVESADAVLVTDDIARLPYLLSLCRRCLARIKVNIVASMIINVTAIVLSALGVLTPVSGALWHNFGSVFVVVSAALLLAARDQGAPSE